MKLRNFACIILGLFACLFFSACDLSFTQSAKTLNISGRATFNGAGLEDVSIKTKTKLLCKTDADGYFSFTINANSLEIFAEKSGFAFHTKTITLTESTENLHFEASEVKKLDGELVLCAVEISPTSLASMPDNYQFSSSGSECLKIKNLKVIVDGYQYRDFIPNNTFAKKHSDNLYLLTEEHSIKTDKKFTINFSLSAYFQTYGNEYSFNEAIFTNLNVPAYKDTSMLNNDNQFEVSLFGVSSSNNKYSYNITFIFDYYPNI